MSLIRNWKLARTWNIEQVRVFSPAPVLLEVRVQQIQKLRCSSGTYWGNSSNRISKSRAMSILSQVANVIPSRLPLSNFPTYSGLGRSNIFVDNRFWVSPFLSLWWRTYCPNISSEVYIVMCNLGRSRSFQSGIIRYGNGGGIAIILMDLVADMVEIDEVCRVLMFFFSYAWGRVWFSTYTCNP